MALFIFLARMSTGKDIYSRTLTAIKTSMAVGHNWCVYCLCHGLSPLEGLPAIMAAWIDSRVANDYRHHKNHSEHPAVYGTGGFYPCRYMERGGEVLFYLDGAGPDRLADFGAAYTPPTC